MTDAHDETLSLCEHIDTLPSAMCAAFTARMKALSPTSTSSCLPPEATDVWQVWFDHLVTLLRAANDDQQLVPLAVALVRWSERQGLDAVAQRLGAEALSWACRDVLPARCTPAVCRALEAQSALIGRIAERSLQAR